MAVSILRMSCLPKPKPVRDFEEISREGVLRVVTDYSPDGYYVSGDTIAGSQYEMVNALARHLGVKAEIHVENNLSQSLKGLHSQRYDLIARNIPITTETKKEVAFTNPIVFDKQVLIQRTAAYNDGIEPIRNQIELGRRVVHVPENSPVILRLHHLSAEIADTIYIVEEKQYAAEQLVYMVVNREIDYAVIDRQTALLYKKRFPALDMQTDIGFTQIQSWAVRQESPALLDSINSWLR